MVSPIHRDRLPVVTDAPHGSDAAALEKAANPSQATRFAALDIFRGVVVFLMLLVNNAALDVNTPPQLMHADWNMGLHLADLVFPWFLLCAGVSIPFSLQSHLAKGKSKWRFAGKSMQRAFALVLLGAFLECAINRQLDFSLGVLQIIGLAGLVGAIVYLGPTWFRALVAVGLLWAYTYALTRVGYPGGRPGLFLENHNLVQHIDERYLAPFKLAGLTSMIPTAALVLLGSMVGDLIRAPQWSRGSKVAIVLLVGLLMAFAGDRMNEVIAYNKPVWTPSYVVVSAGLGTLAIGATMVLADVLRLKAAGYPFLVLGSNPIVAYVAPILVKVMVLQVWVTPTAKGNLPLQQAFLNWLRASYGLIQGGWLYTGTYIAICWLVLWVLYRRRLFVRI
jgi:predicted acyltransferase